MTELHEYSMCYNFQIVAWLHPDGGSYYIIIRGSHQKKGAYLLELIVAKVLYSKMTDRLSTPTELVDEPNMQAALNILN
jgi:hypothetical protein